VCVFFFSITPAYKRVTPNSSIHRGDPKSVSVLLNSTCIWTRFREEFQSRKPWGSHKSSIFWDTTPYTPLKGNRRCGGTYRLHLQSRKRQARNQCEAAGKQAASSPLFTLRPWRWRPPCSSQTSLDFQRTKRRYILEDVTLQDQSRLN
jgi:hypothetical protein